MLPVFTEFAIGLAIIMAGSELLLRGGVSLAQKLGASIGMQNLIVVGMGLSTPLVYTALQASSSGSPDLALNIGIGGAIVPLVLFLGLCAHFRRLPVRRYALSIDIGFMLAAFGMIAFFAWGAVLISWEGLLLLALLARYGLLLYERDEAQPVLAIITKATDCSWCAAAYIFIGFGLVMTGADILIDGSVWIARNFGLQEALVGRTITAIALCLPLAIACALCLHKNRQELIVPILVYSSIFNILGTTGFMASNTIIAVSKISQEGFWIMLSVGILLPAMLYKRQQFGASEGTVLIALFAAYGVYSLAF